MVASLAYYWDSIWYNITKNKYGLETCLEPLIYCQSTLQQVVLTCWRWECRCSLWMRSGHHPTSCNDSLDAGMPAFVVEEEGTPSNES